MIDTIAHQRLEEAYIEYQSDYMFELEQVLGQSALAENVIQGAMEQTLDENQIWELLQRLALVRQYTGECLDGTYSPEVLRGMLKYFLTLKAHD